MDSWLHQWVTRWVLPRSRQRTSRQQLGERSEALAVRFLASRRYAIEARNVRCRLGEIDIIAVAPDHTRCFIEVRGVSSAAWGGALASVTDRKRRRLIRAARWYLQRRPDPDQAVRFDVIGIEWGEGDRPSIEHVEGAFEDDTGQGSGW